MILTLIKYGLERVKLKIVKVIIWLELKVACPTGQAKGRSVLSWMCFACLGQEDNPYFEHCNAWTGLEGILIVEMYFNMDID